MILYLSNCITSKKSKKKDKKRSQYGQNEVQKNSKKIRQKRSQYGQNEHITSN